MPLQNQDQFSSSQLSCGVTEILHYLRLVLGGEPGGQLSELSESSGL